MWDGNDGIKGQTAGPKETTLCDVVQLSGVNIQTGYSGWSP